MFLNNDNDLTSQMFSAYITQLNQNWIAYENTASIHFLLVYKNVKPNWSMNELS